jgi:hypothetical protein
MTFGIAMRHPRFLVGSRLDSTVGTMTTNRECG